MSEDKPLPCKSLISFYMKFFHPNVELFKFQICTALNVYVFFNRKILVRVRILVLSPPVRSGLYEQPNICLKFPWSIDHETYRSLLSKILKFFLKSIERIIAIQFFFLSVLFFNSLWSFSILISCSLILASCSSSLAVS